jgi:hypothetical protein
MVASCALISSFMVVIRLVADRAVNRAGRRGEAGATRLGEVRVRWSDAGQWAQSRPTWSSFDPCPWTQDRRRRHTFAGAAATEPRSIRVGPTVVRRTRRLVSTAEVTRWTTSATSSSSGQRKVDSGGLSNWDIGWSS